MPYVVSAGPLGYLGPEGTLVPWDRKMLFPTLEQAVVTAKMLLDRFYVHETRTWRLVYYSYAG